MRRIVFALLPVLVACGGDIFPSSPSSRVLGIPTGLTATGGNGQITLAWGPVSGATGYVVLRGETSGGVKSQIAAPSAPPFADTSLGEGATEFYVVRAVGPGGTSGDSPEVSATTAVEPVPQGLVATGGVAQISLSWQAVPGATGYFVFGSDTSGGTRARLANPTSNAFTESGLAAGTSRFYVVRATGPAGTSAESGEATASTTPVPDAPSGVVATGGIGQIELGWNAVAGATSYVVLRGGASGGATTVVGTPAANAFTDTGLPAGASEFYVVRAVGPAGASADSPEVSAATTAVPAVPEGLLATGGNGQITLAWGPVSGATGYVVLRGGTSGGVKSQIAAPSASAFADTGLAQGATEFYVVRAVGPAGTSGDSAEVSATTAVEPVPQGLVATGGVAQISLSWQAVPGATGYLVFGSDTSGGTRAQLANPTSNAFTESGLAAGTSRFYVVRAVGPAGVSADSAEVSAATTALPAVPEGLLATAGLGQITLNWNAAAGATGYVVLRGDTSGGGKVTIATPATNSFVDPGLSPGTTEFYAVRAVGPAGTSDASAEASAAVLGPDVPGNLVATPANGSVSLTWTAVAAAASYEVHRSSNAEADAVVGAPIAASFLDGTVRNGVTYRYTVRSVANGVMSSDSAPVSTQPFRALCVVDLKLDQVMVFNAEQPAGTPPIRSFGSQTGLVPGAIAIDSVHGEIFSANFQAVTSHASNATGDAAPLRTLDLRGTSDVAYDPTDDNILIASTTQIQTFARTAAGGAAPIRSLVTDQGSLTDIILTGPAHGDQLIFIGGSDGRVHFVHRTDSGSVGPSASIMPDGMQRITALAYDSVRDEVVVAGTNASGALVAFLSASGGSTAPTRTILGPSSGFTSAALVAVDEANRAFYLNDSSSRVFRFPLDFPAGTSPQPADTLFGQNTHVGVIRDMAIDSARGMLVIAGNDRVQSFTLPAGGDTAPAASIDGDATGMHAPGAIAFDHVHQELAIANEVGPPADLTFYPANASGAVTPTRTLPVNQVLGSAGLNLGFALDPSRNQLLVSDPKEPQVVFYPRTGSAPVRTLGGTATQLAVPFDLVFEPAGDSVLVADQGAIRRYSLSFSDGNEAPLTTIEGPDTGINPAPVPSSIAIDSLHGEIFLLQNGKLLVFNLTDDGNVPPKRVLTDSRFHHRVLVDPASDEVFLMDNTFIQVYSRTASGSDAPLRDIIPFFTFPFLASMAICN
jgi:fibronectin type 3 domain-containing protein